MVLEAWSDMYGYGGVVTPWSMVMEAWPDMYGYGGVA